MQERVLCEVSYCVRLAALRRSDGELSAFQDTFETLTRSLLADATLLSRDLQVVSPDWTLEERSLKIAEIEGLAIRLETTRSAILQQVEGGAPPTGTDWSGGECRIGESLAPDRRNSEAAVRL